MSHQNNSNTDSTPQRTNRKSQTWFTQWGVRGYQQDDISRCSILYNGRNVYNEHKDDPYEQRYKFAFDKWIDNRDEALKNIPRSKL